MPLFDFSDPDNSALLGMVEAAGKAAMPQPFKQGTGAIAGQIAGGALAGAKAGQQYAAGQQQLQAGQLQNQLLGYQVKNIQNYYNLLSGKLGAQPPKNVDTSSEPAQQFGLPAPLQGTDKGTGLPNSMVPSNVAKFDMQPQDYIELGRAMSLIPGASQAAAEMIKLAGMDYLPTVGGGKSFVPGGATDPGVQLRTALMGKLGQSGMTVGQNGTVQNVTGLPQAMGQQTAATSGAEAAAQQPFKLQQTAQEQALITQRELGLENLKAARTPVSMNTPWGNFTGSQLQFQNFINSPTSQATTPGEGEVPLPSGAVVPAVPASKAGFGTPTLDKDQTEMVQSWHNSLQDAYEAKNRLMQLANIYQRVETGGLQTEGAQIRQDLHSLGIDIAPEQMEKAGDIQAAIHQNWITSVKAIKASLGGGGGSARLGQQEILLNAENSFSPDFAPKANYTAVTQTLGELNSFINAVNGWDKSSRTPGGWSNPNQYVSAFYDRNPINGFVKAAQESTPPFKGMAGWQDQSKVLTAPPTNKIVGQTYQTPKGPMTWTKDGWVPAGGANGQ